MKYLSRIAIWLAVFLAVLVWRFPYEPAFLAILNKVQVQTKATISWDTISANLLGAKFTNLQVQMPSGFQFDSDQAEITPSLSGLTLQCTQTAKGGSAQIKIDRQSLSFQAEKLQAHIGAKGLENVTASGNLDYTLTNGALKGEMRLTIPELSGVVPIPLTNIEIGLAMQSEGSKNNVTVVNSKLTLFGEGIDGDGQIALTYSKETVSPALSGDLTIKTNGFGTHTIKLGGTLAQPEWNLAGANK